MENRKSPLERDMQELHKDGYLLRYMYQYHDNKTMVMCALLNYGTALEFVSERLKDDEEVVLLAIKTSDAGMRFASERLRSNNEFMKKAMKINKNSYHYATDKVKYHNTKFEFHAEESDLLVF